jgi:hypothetical protein
MLQLREKLDVADPTIDSSAPKAGKAVKQTQQVLTKRRFRVQVLDVVHAAVVPSLLTHVAVRLPS